MASGTPSTQQPLLAAVDLQFHGPDLIAQALALAVRRDCPLVLLHVVHEAAESPGFYQRHNGHNPTLPMADIAEALLHQQVRQVIDNEPTAAQVPIAQRIVQGIPANRIVEVAEQVDAQAVMLFSHGRDGLGRFWHGSVSEGVRKRCRRELILLTAPKTPHPPYPLVTDTVPGTSSIR